MESGAEQLRNQTSDRPEKGIRHITKTESNAAAAPWVKECVWDRWFLSL